MQGYQYDTETELYYLNARYYDSKIARFLSEDTYSGYAYDPLSLNLYTYCYNNPLIYWDTTGHYPYQAYDANGNLEWRESDVIVDSNTPYIDYGLPCDGIIVRGSTDVNVSGSVVGIQVGQSGANINVTGSGSVGGVYTSDNSTVTINISSNSNISTIITGGKSTTDISSTGEIGSVSTGSNSQTKISNNGIIGTVETGSNSKTTIINGTEGEIDDIVAVNGGSLQLSNAGYVDTLARALLTDFNIVNSSDGIINTDQVALTHQQALFMYDMGGMGVSYDNSVSLLRRLAQNGGSLTGTDLVDLGLVQSQRKSGFFNFDADDLAFFFTQGYRQNAIGQTVIENQIQNQNERFMEGLGLCLINIGSAFSGKRSRVEEPEFKPFNLKTVPNPNGKKGGILHQNKIQK